MRYLVTADTDIGISKETNQDSICFKHASTPLGEVVMAIICDGMGGISKGELASATVIRAFSDWFNNELPYELSLLDMKVIGEKWEMMLKDINLKILEHGKKNKVNLGTTFSGLLIIDNHYIIAHVGDSRVYYINSKIEQLTEDQTVVGREIRRGTMTVEEAKTDPRRNVLLQCVGASRVINPQLLHGNVQSGVYILCSDGFRHEISAEEIYESLNPVNLMNKDSMHNNARYLIRLVKARHEKDNISVIVIKAE